MNVTDWIAIVGLVGGSSGALYGAINVAIDKKIDRKILEYNNKIQDEKILELADENRRLRERVNQTK